MSLVADSFQNLCRKFAKALPIGPFVNALNFWSKLFQKSGSRHWSGIQFVYILFMEAMTFNNFWKIFAIFERTVINWLNMPNERWKTGLSCRMIFSEFVINLHTNQNMCGFLESGCVLHKFLNLFIRNPAGLLFKKVYVFVYYNNNANMWIKTMDIFHDHAGR